MPVSCQQEWCEGEVVLWGFVVKDMSREIATLENLRMECYVCHLCVRHHVRFGVYEVTRDLVSRKFEDDRLGDIQPRLGTTKLRNSHVI